MKHIIFFLLSAQPLSLGSSRELGHFLFTISGRQIQRHKVRSQIASSRYYKNVNIMQAGRGQGSVCGWMVLTMATTIILKPIHLKTTLEYNNCIFYFITKYTFCLCCVCPLCVNLPPAVFFLSGWNPHLLSIVFSLSWQSCIPRFFFSEIHAGTFPSYMPVSHVSHVSCIPCVPCPLCDPSWLPSPTPHLLSITHCFFVTPAGNGVISLNFL